ncbi:hypothetical protein PG987_007915 [Apiospora arundinis]
MDGHSGKTRLAADVDLIMPHQQQVGVSCDSVLKCMTYPKHARKVPVKRGLAAVECQSSVDTVKMSESGRRTGMGGVAGPGKPV